MACIPIRVALQMLWWCRPWQQLQAALPWTGAAQAKQLQSSIQELWERHSSDDLVSMFLVLIDAYVTKVRYMQLSIPLFLTSCTAHALPLHRLCFRDLTFVESPWCCRQVCLIKIAVPILTHIMHCLLTQACAC